MGTDLMAEPRAGRWTSSRYKNTQEGPGKSLILTRKPCEPRPQTWRKPLGLVRDLHGRKN